MPSEYARASVKPLRRDTASPWPTMMDDRMGSIGRTQGVNDSSRPPSRNRPTTRGRLPERSASALRSPESSAALGAVADAGAAATLGVAVAAADAPPGASA